MEQLPGNSHAQRREQEEPPKKKVESVVTGEVVVRKRPFVSRIKDSFFANRADKVGEYVFWDLLIPAAKSMIADGAATFIDRMILGGDVSSRNRGSAFGPAGGVGAYVVGNIVQQQNHTPYHQMANAGNQRPGLSREARSQHDFRQLVFPTRVEAEAVLNRMAQYIGQYSAVTVADFYEMCNLTPNWADDRYGWTDLTGSLVGRSGGGFVINLPLPIPLD